MLRQLSIFVACAALLVTACDSVQPDASERLVVEGFFDAGQPLPEVRVRKTVGLEASRDDVEQAFVSDAVVDVRVNSALVDYLPTGKAGHYQPATDYSDVLESGDAFTVNVSWSGQSTTGSGRIPAEVRLDSIMLNVPAEPIEAVLVDSLRLDSLGIDARTGYLYAVEATMWWQTPASRGDYWIQAQLKPFTQFSSLVLDFILLPEQVFPEDEASLESGSHTWTGLYAIPVADAESPLPPHRLRLAVVRSDQDYADYVITRGTPDRREPSSNLDGALGIVAGISVDSLVVSIDDSYAGKRTRVDGHVR